LDGFWDGAEWPFNGSEVAPVFGTDIFSFSVAGVVSVAGAWFTLVKMSGRGITRNAAARMIPKSVNSTV